MINLEGLYQITVLALATAAISVTISKAKIFASARQWISQKSYWLGELISCSYCTSHWLAIAFVAIYQPVVIQRWIVIDLFVSVFTIVSLSAVVSGLISKLIPFHSGVVNRESDNNFNMNKMNKNGTTLNS